MGNLIEMRNRSGTFTFMPYFKEHDQGTYLNFHVRGYKERGDINTPLELAIENQIDRFNLAIDVIDRVPKLRDVGAHFNERLENQIIENTNHAHEYGIDKPETTNWKWPH